MVIPSIADMVAFQERHGIADHVVYVGDETFVVAHTDPERAAGSNALELCPLHLWLVGLDGPPAGVMTGMAYRATPVVGEGPPWHFELLGGPCARCGWADACEVGECHS